MSRITGNDAKSLMEAYGTLYASQELTEENVWEEVEKWVNSLLDEGHDLSEYTWEEMYIFYLNEASGDVEAAGGDFGRWLKKKGKESINLSKDVLGAQYQGWMGKTTTSKNPVTQAVNLGARITTTPLRDYAIPFVKGMVSNTPSASPKPAKKPVAAKSEPTKPKPQQRDSGREAGEYLAPSLGSPKAADPLVRSGGSYGFFGPIKPPTAKQPPKSATPKPSNTGVKKDPRGAVIVNHFENENDSLVTEAPAQVAPITGTGGKGWYQKNKQGKYVPITDPELAKQAAARWKAEQAKQKQAQTQPQTQPQPETPGQQPLKPQKPAAAKPAAAKPAAAKPAPESPAVREYMKAAAAARKSGDAAQMAKVRDTGLDIWRKKYANTLAKNVTPAGTQRGTGQSVMAKQANELRALRPAAPQSTTSTPEPQAQSALPGGAYSPTATANTIQRTRNIPRVKEQYDAYDLVLEYLFSQGHVETLEEALYVMMEMSSETIQSIVEGVMPEPINPEVHRRLQRIEKATKLQQGTTGAESQAAGSAVKRMGGSGVQLPGV